MERATATEGDEASMSRKVRFVGYGLAKTDVQVFPASVVRRTVLFAPATQAVCGDTAERPRNGWIELLLRSVQVRGGCLCVCVTGVARARGRWRNEHQAARSRVILRNAMTDYWLVDYCRGLKSKARELRAGRDAHDVRSLSRPRWLETRHLTSIEL